MTTSPLNLSEEYIFIEELVEVADSLILLVTDPKSNDPSVAHYIDKYKNLDNRVRSFHHLTPIELVKEIEWLSTILLIPENLNEEDTREKNIGYHIGLMAQKLKKLDKHISIDPSLSQMSFDINQNEILKRQAQIIEGFEELIEKNDLLRNSFSELGYRYTEGDERSDDPKVLVQVIKEKTVFVTSRASDIEDNLKALRALFQLTLIAIKNLTNSFVETLLWIQSKLSQAYKWAEKMLAASTDTIREVSSNIWINLKSNIASAIDQISRTINTALSNASHEEKDTPTNNDELKEKATQEKLKAFNPLGRLDFAVKMGTKRTSIYLKNRGVLVDEPSIIHYRDNDDQIVGTVGYEAYKLQLHRPSGNFIWPINEGVITNPRVAKDMLSYFISKSRGRLNVLGPRVVLCVPSGANVAQRELLMNCAKLAGASQVYLIEKPLAAALGVGLPIHEPHGNLVVNIGSGTTETAVLSLNGIVYSRSVRVGSANMDDSIIQYLRRTTNILVGEMSAERVKKEIGSATVPEDGEGMTVMIKGRDLMNGVPREIGITEAMVAESILEPVEQIVDTVKYTLEATPPELAADIVDKGIMLTGGGALLRNLDVELRDRTGLPVYIADDPANCAIMGAGYAAENLKVWARKLTTIA